MVLAPVPISERSPPAKRRSTKGRSSYRVEASRVKLYFGRDSSVARGIRHDDPHHSNFVVGFLSARLPRGRGRLNWMRPPTGGAMETVHSALALSSQATTMLAKVALDFEEMPSVDRLQGELEASRKQNADLVHRLVVMEKEGLDAAAAARKELDRVKLEALDAKKALLDAEEGLRRATELAKGLSGQLKVSSEEALKWKVYLTAKEAELVTKDATLAAKDVELAAKDAELLGVRRQLKYFELDPMRNSDIIGQFAFCEAFAETIRSVRRGGLGVAPLVADFKAYVLVLGLYTSKHTLCSYYLISI
ncbi:hypothetical protein OROGR_023331 [Orobanche gracilis]